MEKYIGSISIFADSLDELVQGFELLVLDQVELLDEVVVVLEEGVAVSLGVQDSHPVKVVDVHVHEHTEHARQNFLASSLEVLERRGLDSL